MARQSHTAVETSGKYPTAPTTMTATAADAVNFEETAHTGREVIVFRNSGSTTRNITITSVADNRNRTGDITFTLANGASKFVGPLGIEGFRQTNGKLYFQADHAEVLISVIRV